MQQRAIGIENQVAAADLGGIVEAIPQLALVAHDEGFAVERRPDFGVGRVSAELLDDLVPQLPLHVAAGALQFAMTAMNAGQIADRCIFNYKLWRVVGVPRPAPPLFQILGAPINLLVV